MNRFAEILRAQEKPGWFLLSRLLWRTGACRFFTIPRDGYRLRFYPSVLSADLWVTPGDRTADEAFFRSYLRSGDTVVDVGANVGQLTVVAALAVGPKGKVVALEAHPQIARFLEGNIALNSLRNVSVIHAAAGSMPGTLRFSDGRSDDQNAVNEAGKLTVEVKRLDDAPLPEGEIALLKVDVEGFEKPVFEGAERTLERTRCIYFESWEPHFRKFGYGTKDVLAVLRKSGFDLFRPSGARVSPDLISEECENLIAVRDRRDFTARTGLLLEEAA